MPTDWQLSASSPQAPAPGPASAPASAPEWPQSVSPLTADPDVTTDAGNPGLAGTLLAWLLCLASLLAAITAWLGWHFGTAVTIEGQGTIVPGERRQVKAPASGILREIQAIQGRQVRAGDIMARLCGREWTAALSRVADDLAINRHQTLRLQSELRTERAMLERERERCRLELEEARLQLERLRAEAELENDSPLLQSWRRVPFTERLPVRQQSSRIQRYQLQLETADQQLEALAYRRLELETLARRRAQLTQDSVLAAQRLEQTRIRAPAAGTVLTDHLDLRVGDQVHAGEVLLELAPLDSWYADIAVSQQDVRRAVPGQSVRLFVEAFPHLRYKVFSGTVASVSLEPAGDGSGYRTRLRIADPTVCDGERTHSLAYGMRARAQIVVEQGRIVELLWRRLMRHAGGAYRRPLYVAGKDGPA